MPRTFKLPAGMEYPSTLADFKLAQLGKEHKRTAAGGRTVPAPYPEIVASWLANGAVEVGGKEEVSTDGD